MLARCIPLSIAFLLSLPGLAAAQTGPQRPPIIDMHLHAVPADSQGPPPLFLCAPFSTFPPWDPAQPAGEWFQQIIKKPPCASPIRSAMTDDELRDRTLAILEKWNITAVTSGVPRMVDEWKKLAGDRIIPATAFGPDDPPLEQLREWVKSGRFQAFAELPFQYQGIAPGDKRLEPYWALAEELDVPAGIHVGPGPPGAPYLGPTGYRMRLSSALELEDVLVRHPKLRVWAMHAGWPLAEHTIAAMYAHPQLYVDVGVIVYTTPRAEFYRFLKTLVDAGFAQRIMFGSDQMSWPDAISIAIRAIEEAPFLSAEQKRDIFYNNAARFLRLKPRN